jgi:hypothetical protein
MIIPLNSAVNSSLLDPDALSFIKEANITDSFAIRALNVLCKDLKREGIWDSLYYAFPMIFTGTTASMLLDIKNRVSLVEVLPLTGSTAGVTYSSNGFQYNGGVYHALSEITLNPSPLSDTPPGHISIYNRTNHSLVGLTVSTGHGYYESLNGNKFSIEFSATGVSGSIWNATYSTIGNTVSNTTGFYIFSNVNDNFGLTASPTYPYEFYLSRNGEILGTSFSYKNSQRWGAGVVIGSLSQGYGFPLSRSFDQICWYSCGVGYAGNSKGSYIDSNKSEVFYNIVQNFQKALGREV